MTSSIERLGTALRRGEVSAADLTDGALARAHELNPLLNAFVLIDDDGARQAAARADQELAAGVDRGPLHGIPIAVKDLIDVVGLPTSCGSASSFGTVAAERDAAVVARLRAAGAVVVGKTVLHEFGYGATGDRSAHGSSRNAHDPSRMSGGSSGGSAVAVSAGIVPLSIGTDTAGSVRVPAALCGVAGFKSAYGALPTEGVHPLAPSLDHVGLFGPSVSDVRLAYRVLTGPAESPRLDRRPVVGWIPPAAFGTTDPRIEAVAEEALADAGIIPAGVRDLAPWRYRPLFEHFRRLQGREAAAVHRHHLGADRDRIDGEVLARLEQGSRVADPEYAAAEAVRAEFRSAVRDLLQSHDILALPTVPIIAPRIGQRQVRVGDAQLEVRSALLSLTSPWNLTGSPALSVPVGSVDGLPVGLQLITAAGRESMLLQVAETLRSNGDRPAGQAADRAVDRARLDPDWK